MTSDVDVCNMALDLVGQTNIASMADASAVSAICVRHFVPTVREVLRDGKWKSARKSQVELGLLPTSPGLAASSGDTSITYPQVGGWPPGSTLPVSADGCGCDGDDSCPGSASFAWFFQLPSDFIRIVRFNDQDCSLMVDPLFEINGNVLMAAQSVAFIDYVCDVTMSTSGVAYGVNLLDPMLVKAIVYALAVKFSWRFQQSRAQMDALKQDAEAYLRKARAVDAFDEKVVLPDKAAESNWVRARYWSTNG